MSLPASYLDHLDARLEKHGGRDSLTRLLLVATRGEAAKEADAVVQFHERVIANDSENLVCRMLYSPP